MFKNLQTEFREKSRMEAERIEADTSNTIAQEKLIRDAAMEKSRAENHLRSELFKAE